MMAVYAGPIMLMAATYPDMPIGPPIKAPSIINLPLLVFSARTIA